MTKLVYEAPIIEVEKRYDIDSLNTTVTTGELIELLSCYDKDTPVFMTNDYDYSFTTINYDDFKVYEEEEE